MSENITKIRTHVLTHPTLSKDDVENFCRKIIIDKKNITVDSIAQYLLDQFGSQRLVTSITCKTLYSLYNEKAETVYDQLSLLSEGELEKLEKTLLEEETAYQSKNESEVVIKKIKSLISYYLMPLAQVKEAMLRHPKAFSDYKSANEGIEIIPPTIIEELSDDQESQATRIFELLDINENVKSNAEAIEELKKFIYKYNALFLSDKKFVSWVSVIQNWVNSPLFCDKQIQRLHTLLESPLAEKEVVILKSNQIEVQKNHAPSFQEYLIEETLEGIYDQLKVPFLPENLLNTLSELMRETEEARQTITFFIHLEDFLTFPLGNSQARDLFFLRTAQKFIRFRDRVALQIDLFLLLDLSSLLEWIFNAPQEWQDQLDHRLPILHTVIAFHWTNHWISTVSLAPQNCLQIFIGVLRVKKIEDFVVFINRILHPFARDGYFKIDAEFLISYFDNSDFNPYNYDLVLERVKIVSRAIEILKIDSMPGDFWSEVCKQLSEVENFETRVDYFLKQCGDGQIVDKKSFHRFFINYFTDRLSPQTLEFFQRFGQKRNTHFTLQDIIDSCRSPLGLLPEGLTEDDINFVCEKIKLLEKYNPSKIEAGRLFYNFLSCKSLSVLNHDISRLDPFQRFVIIYLKQQFPLKIFESLEEFSQRKKFPLAFEEIVVVSTFYLDNPLLENVTETGFDFAYSQVKELESYDLSNIEAARLFYSFLSVNDRAHITENISYIRFMERFINDRLPKIPLIAWMQYRPCNVKQFMEPLDGLRKILINKYLSHFVVPLRFLNSVYNPLTNLADAQPSEPNQFSEACLNAATEFLPACTSITVRLGFSILPSHSQLLSDAVLPIVFKTLKNASLLQARAVQRMKKINPLFPEGDSDKAIYTAWSIPRNSKQCPHFEISLIRKKTMESRAIHVVLNIPWKILLKNKRLFTLIHKAIAIMGVEPSTDPSLRELDDLFGEYPEVKVLWSRFKKEKLLVNDHTENAFNFIEFLNEQRANITVDLTYLEFQVSLLFYPEFSEIWKTFDLEFLNSAGISENTLAIDLFNFVRYLKIKFREGLLWLAGALPNDPLEKACKPQGNVYLMENNRLSLKPPLVGYQTDDFYTVGKECEQVIEQIVKIVLSDQVTQKYEIPFAKIKEKELLIVSFNPLPQGETRVPLNELSLTLTNQIRNEASCQTDITRIVRYGDLPDLENMIRWHLLTLLYMYYERRNWHLDLPYHPRKSHFTTKEIQLHRIRCNRWNCLL